MYASFKTLVVFFVLFAALVNASPNYNHRRMVRKRTCTKGATSTEVGSKSTAIPASKVSDIVKGTSTSTSTKKKACKATSTGSPKNTDVAKTSSKSSSKSSSTATGAEPESTTTGNATSTTGSSLLSALMPMGIKTGSAGWTTVPGASGALELSDATFNPTNEIKSLAHPYVKAPDGKMSMKATYPKGSYTYGHEPQGGISFYTAGPSHVDITKAKEATLGYSIWFEKGFEFQKGGKLPGIYGGDSADGATHCSGGSRSVKCFSARFMWRTDGKGEFYTYLPPYTIPAYAANKAVCNVKPQSDCNPTYGASIGRGAFNFVSGAWNQISERVRLNDVGKANGELELFFNGKSVINVGGLILRDSAEGVMRGIMMQSFFGGNEESFATPKTQSAYFSDFSMTITETL